ncbi:tetratricopeptide repeat protein [Nocardioides yefusunii]|uniref:Tetratricopeptide repeat protein n=1 Tax=Nocardioides yefusunii TaxID=2500546 RepID=A0ABW1QXY1_9ACTN|nr:tetratricopeptide repeat protein [Nocardioides yefusunii]
MIPPSPRTSLRLRLPLALAATALLAGCTSSPDEDDVAAAGALVEQGISQIAADIDAAARSFERALRLDPEEYLAHYNLGYLAQQADDTAEALAHYDDVLEINPEHGPTLYNSAILLEASDIEAAADRYRDAIAAQPDFAPAHMRLGFALTHLGRTAEAEAMLARGIELDPAMTAVEAPRFD